jgi:uncharacterized MAPEG superfamily protein
MDIKTTGLSFVLLVCYAFVAAVLAKVLNTTAGDITAWMAMSFIAAKQAEDILS